MPVLKPCVQPLGALTEMVSCVGEHSINCSLLKGKGKELSPPNETYQPPFHPENHVDIFFFFELKELNVVHFVLHT